MPFSNTFNSLKKVLSADAPVELTVSNNSITINPNNGNYFFLDNIDADLTINLSNLTGRTTKTIYLRLNFENDNIVISWPTNIKWHEIAPPAISAYEDLFISLMTLDGGTTWYSEPVIKVRPKVDLSNYMYDKYSSAITSLTSLPLTDLIYFNSVRPTSCLGMLAGCASLTSLDLSTWDTSNVTDMSGMFTQCSSLTSLDLSTWDTSKVTTVESIFEFCSSLVVLDLSNWDTSKVTNSMYMFSNNCPLEYVIINSNTVKMTIAYALNSTCKILVPSSALNTYKSHSAWSSRESQFDAIENYTITRSNGQVTVTPNS